MRDDRERLADVLAAIDRIRRYVQDDRTRFDTDELLQSAVLHWIEIIGEAARGVGDKVRTAHPEVPWRVITDMRNRVSHGYFDIDLDVVWNTVTRDLPTRTHAHHASRAETRPRESASESPEGSRDGGGAGGARTHDRRIMRSPARRSERANCTDTTEACRRWP